MLVCFQALARWPVNFGLAVSHSAGGDTQRHSFAKTTLFAGQTVKRGHFPRVMNPDVQTDPVKASQTQSSLLTYFRQTHPSPHRGAVSRIVEERHWVNRPWTEDALPRTGNARQARSIHPFPLDQYLPVDGRDAEGVVVD